MTKGDKPSLEQPVIGIFDFANASTVDLENAARLRAPRGRLKKSGASVDRYRSHLAGRAAAAMLMSKLDISGFVAAHPKWGYLQLVDGNGQVDERVQINISHTQKVAVATFSTSPVGVDVEDVMRDASLGIVRVTTPDELTQKLDLRLEGQKIPRPLLLWTAKEAVSKALGLGITFGMQHFYIELGNELPFAVKTPISGFLKLNTPAVHYLIDDNWLVAICTERELLLRRLTRFRFFERDLLSLST